MSKYDNLKNLVANLQSQVQELGETKEANNNETFTKAEVLTIINNLRLGDYVKDAVCDNIDDIVELDDVKLELYGKEIELGDAEWSVDKSYVGSLGEGCLDDISVDIEEMIDDIVKRRDDAVELLGEEGQIFAHFPYGDVRIYPNRGALQLVMANYKNNVGEKDMGTCGDDLRELVHDALTLPNKQVEETCAKERVQFYLWKKDDFGVLREVRVYFVKLLAEHCFPGTAEDELGEIKMWCPEWKYDTQMWRDAQRLALSRYKDYWSVSEREIKANQEQSKTEIDA